MTGSKNINQVMQKEKSKICLVLAYWQPWDSINWINETVFICIFVVVVVSGGGGGSNGGVLCKTPCSPIKKSPARIAFIFSFIQ